MEQLSTLRTSQQPAAETGRASAGETAPANTRTETAQAVKAAEQIGVAPRLREQEKAEQTNREPVRDAPTGPPPAFEESPLERQARLAFKPPEPASALPEVSETELPVENTAAPVDEQSEPPPTPRQRAEVSFAETKGLASPKEPATVDVEL